MIANGVSHDDNLYIASHLHERLGDRAADRVRLQVVNRPLAAGRQLGWDRLVEVGRHVDQLANEWTALRMFGAHGFTRPAQVVERLRRRTVGFLSNYEQTLHLLEWAIASD